MTETRVIAFQADFMGGGVQRQVRDQTDVVYAWTEESLLGGVLWSETMDEPPLEVWVADEQSAARFEALPLPAPAD